MGELVSEADVARGTDSAGCWSWRKSSTRTPGGVERDLGRVEPQPVDVRQPPGPGQHRVDPERGPEVVGDEIDQDLPALPPDVDRAGVQPDLDPVPGERVGQIWAASRSSLGRNSGWSWTMATFAPSRQNACSQLAPERPAAEDQHPRREALEIEHGLVGEVPGVHQARHRRGVGARPGGDHRPREPELGAVDGQAIRPDEPGVAEEQVDAGLGEAATPSRRG